MSKEQYRALCRTEESIPIFSQDWWLDAVCGEANWNVLLVEKNDRTLAALPFYMPVRGVVTMPQYTQTMGVWFAPKSDDTKYHSALEQRQSLCKQLIERLPARIFLQNFDYAFTDWLPFYWQGFRQTTRYTYLLKDLKNSDLLWENMSYQTRRNIRDAQEKFHITVRTDVSVDDFIHIQNQTFERQHQRNKQDANILRRLIDTCRERGQGEIWGGYDGDGRLHAAAFVVWQQRSAYYIAGGGDSSLRHSGAHSLALWEAVKQVAQYTDTFDFEGSMLPGVERFFREFGGVQTPYLSVSKGKIGLFERLMIKLSKAYRHKT